MQLGLAVDYCCAGVSGITYNGACKRPSESTTQTTTVKPGSGLCQDQRVEATSGVMHAYASLFPFASIRGLIKSLVFPQTGKNGG